MSLNKIEHLKFIQDVIKRMALHQFLIKGWSITLVSAILAIKIRETKMCSLFVLLIPIVLFWLLDTYYLWQERLFRSLYNKVIKLNEKKIDFSMDTHEFKTCWKGGYLGSMFSVIAIFYIFMIFFCYLLTKN